MLEWLVSYLPLDWLISAPGLGPYAERALIAVPGWAIFGLFWLVQPGHYLAMKDYFNAVLFLAAGFMSFYMAWMVMKKGFTSKA